MLEEKDNIETLDVCDRKYTVVFNSKTGELKALRYGQEWQSLSGNKFVYSLFIDLVEERKEKEALLELIEVYREASKLKDSHAEILIKEGETAYARRKR